MNEETDAPENTEAVESSAEEAPEIEIPQNLDELQSLGERATEYLITHSPQIISAVVIVLLGLVFGKLISKFILRICNSKEIDITLSRFFAGVAKLIVVILFLIVAVGQIGISITPMVALMGAGTLGLTLALQGPISNYGAGIAIIITRPFKVDDTLTIHGLTGIVDNVSLGTTQLKTEDGQIITIPNGKILGEILTNSQELAIVEGVVGIEYASDPEKAIAVIEAAVSQIEDVSDNAKPQVGIQGFGDSSIDIGYRFWVPTAKYYKVLYSANLAVFKALKVADIPIPFPQREVKILKDEG